MQGGYSRQLTTLTTLWNDVKIRPLQNDFDLSSANGTEVNEICSIIKYEILSDF